MKKFLIFVSIIFLIIIILLILTFDVVGGKLTINPYAKTILLKINDFIYKEATIHNPSGDVLPDNIDDDIKKELKKVIN